MVKNYQYTFQFQKILNLHFFDCQCDLFTVQVILQQIRDISILFELTATKKIFWSVYLLDFDKVFLEPSV